MAINQRLLTPLCRNREQVEYCGTWTVPTATTTGVVVKLAGGLGMTLTQTGVGLYTLALEGAPAAILDVQWGIVGGVSSGTVLTRTTTGATLKMGLVASPGTAADPTAGGIFTCTVKCLKSLVK